MHRWMAAAGISLLMVIACSNTTSTSSPAGPSTSSASASASCVNKTDFDAAVGSAKDHVSSAVTAAAALNLGTAKDELSKAGQAVQNAANIAGDGSPEMKNELQAAANSVNQAITDLQNNNVTAAATDLQAAGESLTQAASTDANDLFC
jgi:hypothetical protein